MHRFLWFSATVFILAVSILLLPIIGFAGGGAPRVTTLTGAEEVPPADPDGSGFAAIWLNHGQTTVCWEVSYTDIAPPHAAHIHSAPAGQNGGVVVPLSPIEAGCNTDVDPDLIKDIIQNPDMYYVNVHNADYLGGAIRGQLSNRGQSKK